MTQITEGRPQDQGRKHRKRGDPPAATVTLLERYHEAMRRDLAATLDELEPQATGQQTLDGKPDVRTMTPAQRAERWTLAIKLARELGAEVDVRPSGSGDASRTTSRRRGPIRADF